MFNVLDNSLEVSEFKLKSRLCNHFRTNTPKKRNEPSYFPIYGLNSTTVDF